MAYTIFAVILFLLCALFLWRRFTRPPKTTSEPNPAATKGTEIQNDAHPTLTFKIADSIAIPTLVFKLPNGKLIYLGVTLNVSHPTCRQLLAPIGTNQIHNMMIAEIKKMSTIDPNKLTEEIKNSINKYLVSYLQTDLTPNDPITSIILQEFHIE